MTEQEIQALVDATENATSILCGEDMPAGNSPLELMAKKVVRERDALVDALEDITQAAQQEGLHNRGWGEQVRTAVLALSGSHEHLSRRDARMKAEALEEMRDAYWGLNIKAAALTYKERADEYRKQAKGES